MNTVNTEWGAKHWSIVPTLTAFTHRLWRGDSPHITFNSGTARVELAWPIGESLLLLIRWGSSVQLYL